MFKLLWNIFIDEFGGLGITRASLTSSICDRTADESIDATVKVNRLINEQGPQFCQLAPWPFLRDSLSFSITSAASTYSGASYLPATFKKVVAGNLLDGTNRYPLTEVGIQESREWSNPADNTGRPDKFCITRIESGYYEIAFNRLPDNTYTIQLEIETQWVDLTSASSETVITKEYYPAFSHFVSMARFIQQGDTANYLIAEKAWWNPLAPKGTILGTILASLSGSMKRKKVVMAGSYLNSISSRNDYQKE